MGPLVLQVCEIAPLDPAKIGQDQSGVVAWDTGPLVSHTSHLLSWPKVIVHPGKKVYNLVENY